MSSRLSTAAAASFLVLLFASDAGAKSNETVLYDFSDQGDGRDPTGVTLDGQGNVFGTTTWGGPGTCGGSGCGEVFELVRAQSGWTFQTIHAFQGTTSDGSNPSASVVFDAQGNLYGTAAGGGTGNCGVVYELSPQGDGTWNETILYDFKPPGSGSDGCIPESRLVFDTAGNLYGTTYFGGGGNVEHTGCESGCGTVFRLSPKAGGVWKETVLHVFHGMQTLDGTYPQAGVVFDSKGNLWGTTTQGGTQLENCGGFSSCGTVFELSPAAKGKWNEILVYSFLGTPDTGWTPAAGLIIDANDNLYGPLGGPGNGAIFELSPQAGGGVSESLIYQFAPCVQDGGCLDGADPFGGLTFDAKGNLYGTTASGGARNTRCGGTVSEPEGCGTVYELTPGAGGWSEKLLYRFGDGTDGGEPEPDRLVIDADGNLLGSASDGGSPECPKGDSCGAVFAVKP